MTNEPRDNVYGHTMSEWIALIPGDLPYDAISLWHVSVAGEHRFNLTGPELANFIQRGIAALLDAGAIPVKSGKGTPFDWIALHQYGHDKEVIAPAIMTEWEASPKDENYLFSIWFTLPSIHVGSLYP
jgi:hypothetical protein